MRLLVPAILFGIALTLGGALAYESFAPIDPVVIETPRLPSRRAPVAPPPVYTPPAIELFADIDSRPLFSATRAPLQDPAAHGAAGSASDFVLSGIIQSGDRAVILLRNRSTATTTSAVVGDLVNGWRVTRIDATTVVLKANGNEVVVPLDGPANRPPSAPLEPLPQPVPPAPVAAASPPASPPTAAAAPGAKPAAVNTPAKPGSPAHPWAGTIDPEALKGAYIDPKTGEPTL